MLVSFKPLLAALCLFSTIILYGRNSTSHSGQDDVIAQSYTETQKTITRLPYENENGAAIPVSDRFTAQDRTSRILQATMMFGHNYKGLNERALQSHAEHASRWGYGNHVLTREIVGAGEIEGEGEWKKYIFSKILYILRIMTMELEKPHDKRAEWIVWYDADTLILNPNIQWETFLPPTANDSFSDIKILGTKDFSGFNSGLFLCRVDEWVVDVLTDAYAMPRLHPEVNIDGNIEQNAMKWIFSKDENRKHVVYQPIIWYNWFASVPRPDDDMKGDMMIHFSGINHDNEGQRKKAVMDTWFDKLQSDPDAWHVPMERTRYPKEVAAFWDVLRQARELLSVVEHRGDISAIEYRLITRVAMRELKWAVEEEAYDVRKVNRTLHDMLNALRVLEERPDS